MCIKRPQAPLGKSSFVQSADIYRGRVGLGQVGVGLGL